MSMRIAASTLIPVALAVLLGCTVWGEHKPTAWTDVTGGESLERVFWHEVKAGHWADLESRMAPNFVLITSEGAFDRAAAVEHWKQLQIQDFSLGELQSQLNGDTYTVTYILNIRGTVHGKSVPATPLRALTVWQRQVKEQWVMLAHSAIPLSSSSGPPK